MEVVCDENGPALIGRDQHGEPELVTAGAEVTELDAQRPHAVGWIVCRACGHFHLGVVDVRADYDALRCNACGKRAGSLQPEKPQLAQVLPIRPDVGTC